MLVVRAEKRLLSLLARRALLGAAVVGVAVVVGVGVFGVPSTISVAMLFIGAAAVVRRLPGLPCLPVRDSPPDVYFRELEARLRELVPRAQAVLTPDAFRVYLEFLNRGEYGRAVETAAEALSSEPGVPADQLRPGLEAAADVMGIALPRAQ